jgi:ABC-type polysaccharide/polyol phosphate transport system ATPase subunit
MASIKFINVDLEFPVYDVSSLSLRKQIITLATGGLVSSQNGVTKVSALKQVSFEAKDGDSIGIIGHNGAGKTTLLRAMAGIYPPTAGEIQVVGRIGSVFELGAGLDYEVDGKQNIINLLLLNGRSYEYAKESLRSIVEFTELGDFIDLPIRTYSSGMLLRLMFAVTTIEMPEVFLLDEMFSTGDAHFQEKSTKRIEEMMSESSVFVFASHDMALLKKYCNRFFKMSHGKLIEVNSTDV